MTVQREGAQPARHNIVSVYIIIVIKYRVNVYIYYIPPVPKTPPATRRRTLTGNSSLSSPRSRFFVSLSISSTRRKPSV